MAKQQPQDTGADQTAPDAPPAPPVVTVANPPAAAPAAPGIFDELATLERATASPAEQRHTLGAWARAKGVKLSQIRESIKAGRIDPNLTGDGPIMSESEFDAAVAFEYRNTFGLLPTMKVHVPAEVARQGGPVAGEAGAGDPARAV